MHLRAKGGHVPPVRDGAPVQDPIGQLFRLAELPRLFQFANLREIVVVRKVFDRLLERLHPAEPQPTPAEEEADKAGEGWVESFHLVIPAIAERRSISAETGRVRANGILSANRLAVRSGIDRAARFRWTWRNHEDSSQSRASNANPCR